MKKVILVVLLALNVYGSEALCIYFTERYIASNKMLVFSAENKDNKDIVKYARKSLANLERSMSECNNSESIQSVNQKSRGVLKSIISKYR